MLHQAFCHIEAGMDAQRSIVGTPVRSYRQVQGCQQSVIRPLVSLLAGSRGLCLVHLALQPGKQQLLKA